MKLRMYIEAEVSKTVAETIQRSGLVVEPDGTGMKVKVPNTPTVPKRKVKVKFLESPTDTLAEAISKSQPPKS